MELLTLMITRATFMARNTKYSVTNQNVHYDRGLLCWRHMYAAAEGGGGGGGDI